MKEEMLQALAQFHREVVLPDVQRIVDESIDKSVGSLRNEMYTLFDGVFGKFDRLESELAALKGGLARVEARLRELHPYELPEFLVISADAGSEAYLRWVASTGQG